MATDHPPSPASDAAGDDLYTCPHAGALDFLCGANHDPALRRFANECYLAGAASASRPAPSSPAQAEPRAGADPMGCVCAVPDWNDTTVPQFCRKCGGNDEAFRNRPGRPATRFMPAAGSGTPAEARPEVRTASDARLDADIRAIDADSDRPSPAGGGGDAVRSALEFYAFAKYEADYRWATCEVAVDAGERARQALHTLSAPARGDGNGGLAPKCPKCGTDMGVQTVPDDGTLWCGSIKCGHSVGPESPIEDVREYLKANGLDTKPAVAVVFAALAAAKPRDDAAGEGWIPVGERLPEPGTFVLGLGVRREDRMHPYWWQTLIHRGGGDFRGSHGDTARPDYWMAIPAAPARPGEQARD